MSNWKQHTVVRCEGCKRFFGLTFIDTHCPFCKQKHAKKLEAPDMSTDNDTETKRVTDAKKDTDEQKRKFETPKSQKRSFKIWKES